jgi:hypothetical protein
MAAVAMETTKNTKNVKCSALDETANQSSLKSEDFLFWRPFWIQNGRHSKPKWSPYGAACLTPCKHPFPLKSFHF